MAICRANKQVNVVVIGEKIYVGTQELPNVIDYHFDSSGVLTIKIELSEIFASSTEEVSGASSEERIAYIETMKNRT